MNTASQSSQEPRLPYTPPQLSVHGSLEEVTQNGADHSTPI